MDGGEHPGPDMAAIERKIGPILDGFEQERRTIARSFLVAAAAIGGAAMVLALILATMTREGGWPIAAAVAGLGVIAWVWHAKTSGFVLRFKREVVGQVIKAIEPNLDYSPTGMIPQSDFVASDLFRHRIDRYSGEDLVSGRTGQTSLRFSEVHAQYKTQTTDSKGRTRTTWHTIFKGLLIVADCNKHFAGRTIILPDRLQSVLGGFAQMLQSLSIGRDELVKLENPDFEKAFVVYGTDQVEARYLLSPRLMERILAFRAKAGGDLHLSFANANVYLAISSNEDRFEPRIFGSVRDLRFLRELIEDVRLAVGVVEDLNLNTRIWTKQ